MAITDKIQKFVLPLTLAGSAFFSQNAFAQQGFDDKDKGVQAGREKSTLEEKTESSSSHDLLDGYFRIDGWKTPTDTGIRGSTGMRFDTGKWDLGIYAHSQWQKSENLFGGEDLEWFSNRGILELSTYLKEGSDLDVFFAGRAGVDYSKGSKQIDLDAYQGKAGIDFGIGSRANGSKLLITLDGGWGKYDAELLSGFENDGDYTSISGSLLGHQRLFSDGKTDSSLRSQFENVTMLGEEFKHSLYFAASVFGGKDKFGDLNDIDRFGAQIELPYVFNTREYSRDASGDVHGKGVLWQFTPRIRYEKTMAKGELGRTESDADRWRFEVEAKAYLTNFAAIRTAVGYDMFMQDVKGLGKEEKNGLEFQVGLEFHF